MSNQLTARDFAKYELIEYKGGVYQLLGIHSEHEVNVRCGVDNMLQLKGVPPLRDVFDNMIAASAAVAKPILRPLSDMTKEECIEAWSLMSGQEKNLTHVFLFRQYLDDKCWPERPNLQRMLDMSSFLDSRQLDIRDLIDQGLAVSRHEFPNLKYSFEKGGSDE